MPAENGENLVKDIKKKEQEVQKTELKSAQESNVFDPEQFEKTRTSEVVDIVKEEIVIRELDKIEGKINKSPLSKEYKDQISKKLDGKINEWKSSINKVDEKYAEELKMVFGEIVNELKNFNQNKEVKEIYEVVEPYFQNKFLVEQAIKVKVYGRGSGDWQKVNGEVSKITPKLGDIKNVEKLQKILNIDEDGKIGPQTMNALFAMLGSGRKEVQFGQKTILYNEDEIPKPEITPEIQKEIDETFNKLDSKASEIAAKAQTYVDYLMQNGKSAPKHEKDLENYAVSLCELAASCEGIVSLYQKYGMDYPKATIQTKSVTKGSRVLQELKIKIPTTKEEASQLTSQFQAFLLNVRTEYYMETSDENYEQYGRESRVQEREMRNSEAQQLLDQAKGEDSKINGVDEAERVKVESKVSSAMAGMTQDLDSMKGMLANDYQAAYKFGLGLNAKFGETLEGKYDLYGIKSEEISKFPGLKNALSTSAKSAQEQLDQLLVKSINNKDVEKLKQDSTLFVQKTNLYIQSLEVLFKQIEAGQTPSEEWMKRVREGADGVLNDPLIGSIKNSPARGFIKSLNVLDGKTEAERKFNLKFIETFVNLRKSENMMSEYIEKVTGMCVKISGTEGTTWKDDIWESAKPVLITVAAVAGAVAMGALFLATGGVGAVGVLGVAANIGVGSIVTGFGAAYGARLATAAVEQDVEVLADSKGILKDWAVGSAMSAAGGAFGATVGTGIGRGGAAIAGSKLAPEVLKKAASSTAKYGEKMVETSFKVGNAPTTGLKSQLLHVGKELTEETSEELLEDSLQKIGEGLAPNNPVAGFVFSMIPSTLRQSRTSFMKGNGRFQAGAGVTGKIVGNGVEFQYTDKDSAVAYMRERGAPEDVLTALETNESVDVTVNGVRIKVEQESKADTEESKVGGGGGGDDDNENGSSKDTSRAKGRHIAGGIRAEAEARGNKQKSRRAKNNSKVRRAADPKKAGKQEKIDQRRQERRAREAANRANNQTEADRVRLEQEEAARQVEEARQSQEPQVADKNPEDFKIKDEIRVKSEGVDSNMDTEAIKSYIEKVKSDSSQPKLTRLILSNPMLTPTTTIKVGDRVFYAGPVIATKTKEGGVYLQSIMFTEVDGKLVPRAFYKSNSDNWRVTPYFAEIYSKGDKIHYTQETKPHETLSAYLGEQVVNQEYNGDFIQEYFGMMIADENGNKTFNDGLGETKTFSAEHSRYDDGGKLDGVRQFNPGQLNKDLRSREDLARLEKVTSVENLPDGFVPDFSGKPVRSYQMDHTIFTPATGNKITVDVYQGVLDGQSIEWHMAHDSQGRVWVDRINFQNDKYNSYGVVSNLIHSGILTSKPIDYTVQIDRVLKYPILAGAFSDYSDITPLIDRMGPIKKFRQQRNIQHRNLHRLEFSDVARTQDIVAVPDTHGDFKAFNSTLEGHGLIDGRGTWIGGDTRIQILGDIFDRGPDAIKILKKIGDLKMQGARVDLLVGNHEDWMLNALLTEDRNALANWGRYADAEQRQAISSGRSAEYLAKYRDILEIYRSSKIIEQVDDVIYMHGELSIQGINLLEAYGSVDAINEVWQEAVGRAFDGDPSMLRQVSKDFHPFLWSRAISEGGKSDSGGQMLTATPEELIRIESVLKNAGVNIVVHGHTPQRDGVVGTTNLGSVKIMNADTALSAGMSESTPSAGGIKITKDAKFSIIDANNPYRKASSQ